MKNIFIAISLLFSIQLNSQSDLSWFAGSDAKVEPRGNRQIIPQKYLVFKLNGSVLKNQLFAAPNEKAVKINESTSFISLPTPDGSIQQFKVVESNMMEPGLAAQFPNMKTFNVVGISDVYANGKLDWNEFGFHGMIRTVNGDYFIDPYCVGNTNDYITYYTKDFVKAASAKQNQEEILLKGADKNTPSKKKENEIKVNKPSVSAVGQNLRTYRLAVACTGEYAIAATGLGAPSIAQTLAKIITSVNRVNGVFETETAIRLVLVATETNVIFTVPATDPFTGNNNAGVLIVESKTVIDANVFNSNYDIGHTFSTGGGGLATLGCVCNSTDKADGITGSSSPVGDPYDIDYVVHEMGHQFGGDHTFNSNQGSCGGGNRNAPSAVEPGSGITIMAYAGLCGASNDYSNNSIAYFHAVSFDQIIAYSQNAGGNSCPINTSTGNSPPVVTGPGNFIIPKSTAFFLSGSATDPDGDPLTYSWEEVDPGIAGTPLSGNKPFFRSYTPTITPTRIFPNLPLVLAHTYTITKGEYVPTSPQTLNFRLTARDNKVGGGGVAFAPSMVTVDNSGPFLLTYPNATGITWYATSSENVTWDVNGTTAAPVSCDTVRILLSYDNGNNYVVLNNSTPNDGSQLVTVPTVTAAISTCRLKIEGKGNIFFDVSNNTFTVSQVIGIKKISQNNPFSLNVWPNPFKDKFNVSANNLSENTSIILKITDVLGKLIFENTYFNKTELSETIDLSTYTKGVYFVSIANGNMSGVYRLIKD